MPPGRDSSATLTREFPPGSSAMHRIRIFLFCMLPLFPPPCLATNVGRAFDPVDSLELRIFLEDSVYLQPQAVSFIACATNRGSKVLPAITQPSPSISTQ